MKSTIWYYQEKNKEISGPMNFAVPVSRKAVIARLRLFPNVRIDRVKIFPVTV